MSYSRVYATALMTIIRKEVRRFASIWIQTIVPAAITTALYFLIFGKVIGSQIADMDGYSYIEFIVPGLVLMSVLTNAYGNVVSSFYSSKFQHYVDELLIAPVPDWIILAGYVFGGVARGLTVGLVVILVAMLFTRVQLVHPLISLLVFVLTAILFSIAGFINAVFANNFDDISIVPTFVLTPLTYLGGVFYSISLLPPFWQSVSLANPVLYMVNGFRYGMLGRSDIDIEIALLIIVAFILLLWSFALRLLAHGTGLKT
ncbi:MAG: ABC transporter permease [gamma proteobacterium symbiont of Bathyaustriella thionipta]|nr:ABC transporter permease [gamma proteobacterium symbiont of Bathyaustriella thionipta]